MESVNKNPTVGVANLSNDDDDSHLLLNNLSNSKNPPASQTLSNKKATIWDDYEKYKDSSGKERAKCKWCKSYAIGSNSHGTTNLRKHLTKCAKYKHMSMDVDQMLFDQGMKLRKLKICQETYREKMAISIMKHNYSFLMVDHECTRDVHSYLNLDVKPYSRNTAKADCLKIYKREKEKLKLALGKVDGRICFTSDVWSSITQDGYICLTAHFVDEDWRLHNNASTCDNLQDILKNQLRIQNSLLCGGEFFHVRCSAHILNLIVQDGLKIANVAIQKIRDSIRYVKGSEGRLRKFADCCAQVGIVTSMGLRMDVPTRWNSTFFMLECAIKFRTAFVHYDLVEMGYIYCPSEEEWERGVKIAKFLKPFAEMTNLVSGSEYPTANLYFIYVWRIQLRLFEEMMCEDEVISDMAQNMYPKFEKYWDSYSIILAMAVVLDPRYKFEFVRFCYNKIDSHTAEGKVSFLKGKLFSLFQEYVDQYSTHDKDTTSVGTNGTHSFTDDICEYDYYRKR
ncbi:zinc finger BED domain-containing protein RICESLEEPER 2-like [Tasmannia lanceolata]|uniref:zinc finger BED domain-containing protein RICESLEEPER 2-like n=1 Tax=Tasmannia lanceolata TaxID=3420 RepID=UPI004063FC4A